MDLLKYNTKKIELIDIEGNKYSGYAHYCNKEDYEAVEDSLELMVGNNVWAFYESDIKEIEVLD